jgi:23S rRNA pseudouridine955/2504/2580 synthase
MSPEDEKIELIAGPDDSGRRLDKVLRSLLEDRPLSAIYASLRKGQVRVNGAKATPDLRLAEGDRIYLPAALRPSPSPPRPSRGVDEGLEGISDILVLATRDLLFVNKPRGLLSQGDEELEGRVRAALASRSAASLSFTPGPLHRLDRNTTGVLAFPRSAAGARAFTELMRRRALVKRYLALIDGEPEAAALWRDLIVRDDADRRSRVSAEGDEAISSMTPLLSAGGRSLVAVELLTGLTHQIRVQASSRGIPLSGDSKYGGSPLPGGYVLHALSLGFPEPPFPDLPASVSAPLPAAAIQRLEALFGVSPLRRSLEGTGALPEAATH